MNKFHLNLLTHVRLRLINLIIENNEREAFKYICQAIKAVLALTIIKIQL